MKDPRAIAFENLLLTDWDTLRAERLSMPDAHFAKNHGVSPQRVISLMWPIPRKDIANHRKVILDPVEVHKLRAEWWSDVRIANHFHTANSAVSQQCWDRKSNGFKPKKRWSYKEDTDLWNRDLNTKTWNKEKKDDEYWREEKNIVHYGEWPISILNQLKKW